MARSGVLKDGFDRRDLRFADSEGVVAIDLKAYIREIPDFPTPGVNFKDITPLFADGRALNYAVKALADAFRGDRPDVVVGVESRGFLIGAPLAYELGVGLVVVRKPGKLPRETLQVAYELEYGTDALEVHRDALQPGQRVLMSDDLLATGGTMEAAGRLVKMLGGSIVGYAFLVELDFLKGRDRLEAAGGTKIVSLVHYSA